ncbi:MAG: FtsQ-type POTRA domain-containing protein [Erysipelotrichaceae bacterium]|nr:FtsQ-type POTRA domain-containing protein [Erysipelotrichaceae bacterium]
MLDDKENLLEKNRLFNIRKYKKASSAYEKAKNFYFALSILLSLILIALIYLLSSASDIYRITVEGNVYLKDEDIIQASGLDTEDKFFLTFPSVIRKRIEKEPLIAKADVSLMRGRLVRISVEEKKIVAYAPENGLNVLILADGSRVGISKQNMYLISKAPIVEGFDEQELELLIKELDHCERKIIEQISEIHYYPQLKYQYVELVMADGDYVFTSPYGLGILNHYFDIKSSYISSGNQCYYFEDISGNAYTSACPWEPVQETETIPEEETGDDDI